MKSKEEIRKMAEKFAYAVDGKKEGDQSSAFAYEMGYTKCQEDNKDKKYTEEDMLKAFYAGVDCEFGGAPSFDQWIKKYKQD